MTELRLPLEITQYILMELDYPKIPSKGDCKPYAPLVLSSYWRLAAISCPFLWTDIHLHEWALKRITVSALGLWLSRSKSLPISVTIDATESTIQEHIERMVKRTAEGQLGFHCQEVERNHSNPDSIQPWWKNLRLLYNHVPRWKSMSFSYPDIALGELVSALYTANSALTRMEISTPGQMLPLAHGKVIDPHHPLVGVKTLSLSYSTFYSLYSLSNLSNLTPTSNTSYSTRSIS